VRVDKSQDIAREVGELVRLGTTYHLDTAIHDESHKKHYKEFETCLIVSCFSLSVRITTFKRLAVRIQYVSTKWVISLDYHRSFVFFFFTCNDSIGIGFVK
jgi:hypothetical protein